MLLCYYVIMLLCYYKEVLPLQLFSLIAHATLYVYETYDKWNNTESSPRPLADNIYHFRQQFKFFPSPTLPHLEKNQGKREEIPNKMPNFVGSQ